MKVKKTTLLLLACTVWGLAGYNILRLGLIEYPPYLSVVSVVLSITVFALFHRFIFGPLVKKHTTRILSYMESRKFFLCFFDKKSFIIMAVMMAVGILLRSSALVPRRFIAVFYTGLGTALLLAGIQFGVNFLRWKAQATK